VEGEVPSDIYQQVADVCTRKLRGLSILPGEDSHGAQNWLALFKDLGLDGAPRALTKKPVMTLPYGSTMQACTQSVFRWLHEEHRSFFPKNTNFKHAIYLSPILWRSISEVVVAARESMTWLQQCASVVSKLNAPLLYVSPLGFPVYQAVMLQDLKKIDCNIGGSMVIRMASPTNKIDIRKQRQGSSPNLVHHADATHMMMCVNAGVAEDIDCYAMIHDDFGVHANRVDTWQRIIREQFVKLHTDHDILADFKEFHEARNEISLPDLPDQGALDLNGVLKSLYFFG
jgi:DNA-directed RNA polymerase